MSAVFTKYQNIFYYILCTIQLCKRSSIDGIKITVERDIIRYV